MKTILTIHEQDINPDAPVVDYDKFGTRQAARAVVYDQKGAVALLHVGLYDYHKLPGGGIDKGEDIASALTRELLEEIGCIAEVMGELGKIIEYRDQLELRQTSYCFTAKQIGKKGRPSFTAKEIRELFSIVWSDNIDSAIKLIEQDKPTNYQGHFIQKRDLAMLKAAKELR